MPVKTTTFATASKRSLPLNSTSRPARAPHVRCLPVSHPPGRTVQPAMARGPPVTSDTGREPAEAGFRRIPESLPGGVLPHLPQMLRGGLAPASRTAGAATMANWLMLTPGLNFGTVLALVCYRMPRSRTSAHRHRRDGRCRKRHANGPARSTRQVWRLTGR
jgi:hypothetical protein